jgi:hypothetical protein
MKSKFVFLIIILPLILIISSCKTTKSTNKVDVISNNFSGGKDNIIIEFLKGSSFNHPTYVVWMEDNCGNYIRTLYITKSYASGIFGRQMKGDTLWLKNYGQSFQPAALPYWTYKKGLINGKSFIPTPENQFVDGYSGATSLNDFKFETTVATSSQDFRILVEVNQAWDWNEYWTNNKYPDNLAYKHSAQPSVVYEARITPDENEIYFHAIGHGDPKGETGKLYSNFKSVTSQIFKSIKIYKNSK